MDFGICFEQTDVSAVRSQQKQERVHGAMDLLQRDSSQEPWLRDCASLQLLLVDIIHNAILRT